MKRQGHADGVGADYPQVLEGATIAELSNAQEETIRRIDGRRLIDEGAQGAENQTAEVQGSTNSWPEVVTSSDKLLSSQHDS